MLDLAEQGFGAIDKKVRGSLQHIIRLSVLFSISGQASVYLDGVWKSLRTEDKTHNQDCHFQLILPKRLQAKQLYTQILKVGWFVLEKEQEKNESPSISKLQGRLLLACLENQDQCQKNIKNQDSSLKIAVTATCKPPSKMLCMYPDQHNLQRPQKWSSSYSKSTKT